MARPKDSTKVPRGSERTPKFLYFGSKARRKMHTSNLSTFGSFALSVNGVPVPNPATRKARALLAFLAIKGRAGAAREQLLEAFWPDVEPARARDSLSTALHSIRLSLRAAAADVSEFLTATSSTVRWVADTSVDATLFAELSAQDDLAANAEALLLYRGDFLEGDYDDWSASERERLATLYEALLARLVRKSHDPTAAQRLLARNPYAEEAYAALLESDLRAGRSASAISLVDQCRKTLAEIGEKPSDAFEERFGHIKRRSLDVPPSNLPRQRTTFVGRNVELHDVKALIAKSQLTTIAGAGGVGKTRVALQAGAELRHAFDDGVWFADLAKVATEESVIPEVASAFEVKSQGFTSLFDHLLAQLKHKRLLLILDNCEHVVSETARVIDAILTACPRVTILATSREILATVGEHVYQLPSLDVPPLDEKLDARTAMTFSAVTLFAQRAGAVDARFAITDATAVAVGDICRRLDGIALAIELAAARMSMLSVDQLLELLDKQFRLLTSANRAVHPRHRTMRATLDWSYDWLSESEKKLFRRLAIFQSGWAIEALVADDLEEPLDEVAALEILSSLVNKSLVTVKFDNQPPRYRLIEPLRQYGLERLKECEEFEKAARCHAQYFAEFVRRAADTWGKTPELTWLASIEGEFDNVRAALEWSLLHLHDPVLGAQIAERLGPFWFSRHYHEGLRWLDLAQAAVSYEAEPTLSVAVAAARARSYAQANMGEALRICEEFIERARLVSEELHLRRLLFFYGACLAAFDRFDEAEAAATESLERCERSGDAYRVAFNCWTLARLSRRFGRVDAAKQLSNRMAAVYEGLNLPQDRNRWIVMTERARVAQLDGHTGPALELCREALSGAQLTDDPLGEVTSEYFLAVQLLMAGTINEARNHGRTVLKVSLDELLPHGVTFALQVLAGVATHRAEHDLAAQLLGYAEKRFREQPFPRNAFVDVDPDFFMRPLRDRFGERRLAELMVDGERWSEDQAIDEALKIRSGY
jgi:predicted ATPase/DNA-binding SARP family transcriptional activator